MQTNRFTKIILGGAFVTLLISGCSADEPQFADVFVSGQEGYKSFRIPATIASPKGDLLAFAEGRKHGAGDSGDIDLVLKRSLDGGKTWGQLQVVWDDAANTCGNPCPVVDRKTGVIWLLLTHNLGRDHEGDIMAGKSTGTRTVWVSHSKDDGLTWSKPAEITATTKATNWTWYATGPGIGIQLKSGRLVIPCDHAEAKTRQWFSHVIYSDDHGANWKLGGTVGPKCNESQIVERSDGSLLFNMRSYRGGNRRLTATSADGGSTFTEPVKDEALIEPVCQASILRLDNAASGTLLFANPASTKREKMTVRLSRDDGKTWPLSREIHAGSAAYCCLVELPDQHIGCFYEVDDYRRITFARFPLQWIKEAVAGVSPARDPQSNDTTTP